MIGNELNVSVAAEMYVSEKGFEHSGGIIEQAFEAGARWALQGGKPMSGNKELIEKIAQVSVAVGFQAGEPAMEIAGQIVSVLAANPENIDRFMAEGTELFLDGTFNAENGSLTYRAINGSILSPTALRRQKGSQQ
jgi:hypothetical protein